ncbi:hypothetical protein COT72_01575 [archaeon CG10_big_fil_rev_8_21_14_0_10_43_11]|nr:MAG: hypothetical protein COT72_01575 [archaeon CG10_big_fil_rev_8_21_14_0_10_43_11]
MLKNFDPIEMFCNLYLDKSRKRAKTVSFSLALGVIMFLVGSAMLAKSLGYIPANVSVGGVFFVLTGVIVLFNAFIKSLS